MALLQDGQVVRAAGGFYDVRIDGCGEVVRCTMRGRLKRQKRRTDLCVIGDRVRIETSEAPTLEAVEPRRNVFSRRHPGRGGRYQEDVLAANLDRLFIMFAFGDAPPMRARLVDRFLVVAEQAGIEAVLIANKLDLRGENDPFESYERLGYEVLRTRADGAEPLGLGAVRVAIDNGAVTAFLGPSGVGKSSLLNALEPGLELRVGEISRFHGKGRHTTRVATLHPACGGYIADTPGIRELGAWELDRDKLDRYFVEMRPLIGACAFGDCRHDHEPKCAVKAMVGVDISEARYESYLRILRDDDLT